MTTEVLQQTLQAGVQATFGRGRVWYIKSASAALTIRAEKLGTGARVWSFINVGAGFKFKAEDGSEGWDYLRITSATAQTIEIVIGDDDVDVANAVSVTGIASTQENPTAALATPARVAVGTAEQLVIAANLSRRKLTLQAPTTNTDSVNIGPTGQVSAIRGLELAPGESLEFVTTAAVYGWAVSGSQDVQVLEET